MQELGQSECCKEEEERVQQMLDQFDANNDGPSIVDLWRCGSAVSSDDEDEGSQLRVEQNLRRQLCQTRDALERSEARVAELEEASRVALRRAKEAAAEALRKAEETFEEEMEGTLDFWRSLAQSSAGPKLAGSIDIGAAQLLGNGKYGFVFKSTRHSDNEPVVVKLLSLRWAHVAAKEWGRTKDIGAHPNIVEYEDAVLHADEDKCIAELLEAAQEQGKLQCRTKRQSFPSRYICFMQEFMNRGTVQDWMDQSILLPGGLLVTTKCVAGALSHMHQRGITHNDIKPENVLLKQPEGQGPHAEVTVKLADFGLAAKSSDKTADFALFGMTVLCMVTGEKFGTRKFKPEASDSLVNDVARCVSEFAAAEAGQGGKEAGRRDVGAGLALLPGLLKRIWAGQVTMRDVAECPGLAEWGFFEGELRPGTAPASQEEQAPLTHRSLNEERVLDMALLSARRATDSVRQQSGAGAEGGPEAEDEARDATAPANATEVPLTQRNINEEKVRDMEVLSARRATESVEQRSPEEPKAEEQVPLTERSTNEEKVRDMEVLSARRATDSMKQTSIEAVE